ncbi:transcriptional regulator, RpiR family [Cetobacterium ceti]|uniref:Transcriptional regulator, RpiR family n=1 Tax=Cetobacterium ceti TaxID=180163 RepID=A0A1T4NAJ3_9FUSO|nr:MurR/RpiR family transcriptional regulator [Cetobacterium ceti]SJZ76093.1 transcriptional regulator, RpiR family [Cetobacterium ceti]
MLTILENKIKDKKLTKTEKIIAEYFYKNENKLYFLTSTNIAEELEISDTSVIRFVKALGFKNFTEFKENLKGKISEQILTPREKLSKHELILNQKNISKFYTEYFEKIVQETFEKNSLGDIEKLVNLLLKSRKKFVVGFKSTSGLASFFGLRLGFVLENVITHPRNNSELIKNIIDMNEDDCLFIIAHPKYSKTYNLLIEIAQKAKGHIVVITDKKTSPVANLGDITLTTNIEGISYFNSLISTQVLIEYILTILSTKLTEKMKNRLSIVNDYLNRNL